MPLPPNARLGRYKVRSQLGVGGLGEVYLIEDTELERQVALKVLLAKVAADEDRVRRFVQAAKAASALKHPNILTVYDIGKQDGAAFIVEEWLGGDEPGGRLNGSPVESQQGLRHRQGCTAL
jgi:eukaryotic-like serine/threonine-protein kinase